MLSVSAAAKDKIAILNRKMMRIKLGINIIYLYFQLILKTLLNNHYTRYINHCGGFKMVITQYPSFSVIAAYISCCCVSYLPLLRILPAAAAYPTCRCCVSYLPLLCILPAAAAYPTCSCVKVADSVKKRARPELQGMEEVARRRPRAVSWYW